MVWIVDGAGLCRCRRGCAGVQVQGEQGRRTALDLLELEVVGSPTLGRDWMPIPAPAILPDRRAGLVERPRTVR